MIDPLIAHLQGRISADDMLLLEAGGDQGLVDRAVRSCDGELGSLVRFIREYREGWGG